MLFVQVEEGRRCVVQSRSIDDMYKGNLVVCLLSF